MITYSEYLKSFDYHSRAFFMMTRFIHLEEHEQFVRTFLELSGVDSLDELASIAISDTTHQKEKDFWQVKPDDIYELYDAGDVECYCENGNLHAIADVKSVHVVIPDGATHIVEMTPQLFSIEWVYFIKDNGESFDAIDVNGEWETFNYSLESANGTFVKLLDITKSE